MPAPTKKISIAEAKALAEKAKQQKENPQPPPEENTPSIDPPKEIMEQEEQELLRKYEEQDNEPDPDVVAAQKVKEANAIQNAKTPAQKKKEYPANVKRSQRPSNGKAGKVRPCAMCQKPHEFGDPRSKYCPICAKIVAAEAALEGGTGKALKQSEVEEKLRPFLRIGLNLKEACLEAEYDYGNIIEKKKEWKGFADFIERHQNYAIIKAKRNIFEINSGGKDNVYGPKEIARTSRWLLERRRPNEYGPRVSVAGTVATAELDDKKKALMGALLAATL